MYDNVRRIRALSQKKFSHLERSLAKFASARAELDKRRDVVERAFGAILERQVYATRTLHEVALPRQEAAESDLGNVLAQLRSTNVAPVLVAGATGKTLYDFVDTQSVDGLFSQSRSAVAVLRSLEASATSEFHELDKRLSEVLSEPTSGGGGSAAAAAAAAAGPPPPGGAGSSSSVTPSTSTSTPNPNSNSNLSNSLTAGTLTRIAALAVDLDAIRSVVDEARMRLHEQARLFDEATERFRFITAEGASQSPPSSSASGSTSSSPNPTSSSSTTSSPGVYPMGGSSGFGSPFDAEQQRMVARVAELDKLGVVHNEMLNLGKLVEAASSRHTDVVDRAIRFFGAVEALGPTIENRLIEMDSILFQFADYNTRATGVFNEMLNLAAWYRHFAQAHDELVPEIVRRHRRLAEQRALLEHVQAQLAELESSEERERARFFEQHGRYLPPGMCPAIVSEPVTHCRVSPDAAGIHTDLPPLEAFSAEHLAAATAASPLSVAPAVSTGAAPIASDNHSNALAFAIAEAAAGNIGVR